MTPEQETTPLTIDVILFDGFELLDVFGPVELFSKVPGLTVRHVAATREPVASAHGVQVVPEATFDEVQSPDVLLVPGGLGTRLLVDDHSFLSWLSLAGQGAGIAASVCTGSALLAAAGLLDGHRATSNKLAFAWATGFGDDVTWEPQARWVADGNRWTSSGVAAGMDMAAALIEHLVDATTARAVARRIEYEPNRVSTRDPFAVTHGLVPSAGPADDLVVREFTRDDAVAVSRLIGHTMLTTNVADYPVERLRELAEWFSPQQVIELNASRTCLVAERGGAVLGTIGFEEPRREDERLVTTLVTFFVAPSTQGQGLGARLLEAIESRARTDGIAVIHLEASLAGVTFYQRHGFVPTGGTVQGHAGEHVQMVKDLA